MAVKHSITKLEHPMVRRQITVVSSEAVSPYMQRVTFYDESLRSFAAPGFDDHVKLFFPDANGKSKSGKAVGRHYTPRRCDAEVGTLTVDFALHAVGVAAEWARQAAVGDRLEVGGPRKSLLVSDNFDWYLLIGDESALPAIGRWLEGLRPEVPVTTVVVLQSLQDRQAIVTAADWSPVWVVRNYPALPEGEQIERLLREMTLPPGDGYIWLAGESTMVHRLKEYLLHEQQQPEDWLHAKAYWKRGASEDD